MTRCAISYLLKNGCKINEKEEDALETRIPKGRDLTAAKWLETIVVATHNVPKNEAEAKSWQHSLLRQSSKLPFPVAYETNEDMTWFKGVADSMYENDFA